MIIPLMQILKGHEILLNESQFYKFHKFHISSEYLKEYRPLQISASGTYCKLSPKCRLARGNIKRLGIFYSISKSNYFNLIVIVDSFVQPKWVFLLESRSQGALFKSCGSLPVFELLMFGSTWELK